MRRGRTCYPYRRKNGSCGYVRRRELPAYCDDVWRKCQDPGTLAKEYHDVCDPVWDEDCSGMTEEETAKTLARIGECIRQRRQAIDTCVHPDCYDPTHEGAISKMRERRSVCKGHLIRIKSEKDLERATKRRQRIKKIQVIPQMSIIDFLERLAEANDSHIITHKKENTVALKTPTGLLYTASGKDLKDAYWNVLRQIRDIHWKKDLKYWKELLEYTPEAPWSEVKKLYQF